MKADKNYYLHNQRRGLIRKNLNRYLGIDERVPLKKALDILKKKDYGTYKGFVRDPIGFLKGVSKLPRLLDN